jgi:hypothetical protein
MNLQINSMDFVNMYSCTFELRSTNEIYWINNWTRQFYSVCPRNSWFFYLEIQGFRSRNFPWRLKIRPAKILERLNRGFSIKEDKNSLAEEPPIERSKYDCIKLNSDEFLQGSSQWVIPFDRQSVWNHEHFLKYKVYWMGIILYNTITLHRMNLKKKKERTKLNLGSTHEHLHRYYSH